MSASENTKTLYVEACAIGPQSGPYYAVIILTDEFIGKVVRLSYVAREAGAQECRIESNHRWDDEDRHGLMRKQCAITSGHVYLSAYIGNTGGLVQSIPVDVQDLLDMAADLEHDELYLSDGTDGFMEMVANEEQRRADGMACS